MNIFTAAITGLTIVIKKIGIDFIASMITAIVNAIVSAIKWLMTKIINFINFLFRTYLRLESGCVPPVQKFVGLTIRLRWGFVILSGLYAVYKYLRITALLVAIAVCGGLVAIGYSQAEKEEEEWNSTFDWVNRVVTTYLKYLIRLLLIISSVYLIFHNKIVAFPIWNNKLIINNVQTVPTKKPNLSKEMLQDLKFLNGQSHPPADEMRANYMKMLEDMHVTAKDYNPAKDGQEPTMSCLACHAYPSITMPDCWRCHVKP